MPTRRSQILAVLVAVAGGVLLLPAELRAQDARKPPARGPYGWQVMTEEEKVEYSQTLERLTTPESRAAFRVEHRETMKARAREQGISLSGPGDRKAGPPKAGGRGAKPRRQGASGRHPVGWDLMSEQEKAAYKDTLQQLGTREERTAFREEHREKMEARAAAEGVTLTDPGAKRRGTEKRPIYGQELMTEEERVTFLETFRRLQTSLERNEFRKSHALEMQRRAEEQGVALPPPKGLGGAAKAARPATDPSDQDE